MSDTKDSKMSNPIFEYEWMLRPCEMYREEYSDCTSIKARFNQYFIYGETQDCSQWKRDYNSCVKWKDEKDVKAANELIASEKDRRRKRLGAHYANDTWERRKSPPEDWSKPLPELVSKDYENSYLGIKSREMNGEIVAPSAINQRTLCTIL